MGPMGMHPGQRHRRRAGFAQQSCLGINRIFVAVVVFDQSVNLLAGKFAPKQNIVGPVCIDRGRLRPAIINTGVFGPGMSKIGMCKGNAHINDRYDYFGFAPAHCRIRRACGGVGLTEIPVQGVIANGKVQPDLHILRVFVRPRQSPHQIVEQVGQSLCIAVQQLVRGRSPRCRHQQKRHEFGQKPFAFVQGRNFDGQ